MIDNAKKSSSSGAAGGTSAQSEQDTAGFGDHIWTSLTTTVVLGAICCGLYTAIIWGIGQILFPVQAGGSLVKADGSYTTKDDEAVGSALLGQNFSLPQYFHPRPSAAGNGYDGTSSGGTNLGPLSDKLLNGVHGSKKPDGTSDPGSDFDGVKDLVAAYRTENELKDDWLVPSDAVTRSGSGLDPHITPRNAQLQKPRVAKARNLSEDAIQKLINQYTDGPSLGVLGDPRVNVLLLNLALDKVAPVAAVPPADSASPPAKDAGTPEKDTTQPAKDSTPPGQDATPPAKDETPPVTPPATPPAKVATPPASGTNPPVKSATSPSTPATIPPAAPPAKAATPPVTPPAKTTTPPATVPAPTSPPKK